MATKTAMQASDEIACLENGIAELEALLAAQEQGGNALPNVVEFPSLPAVVVVEEEDEPESTVTTTPTSFQQEGIKGNSR